MNKAKKYKKEKFGESQKQKLMHDIYGIKEDAICENCEHCILLRINNRAVHKCDVYGLEGSKTNWRISYEACGLYPGREPTKGTNISRLAEKKEKK